MYHGANATLGEEDDERDDTDDDFVIDDEDGQELAAGSTVQTNLQSCVCVCVYALRALF